MISFQEFCDALERTDVKQKMSIRFLNWRYSHDNNTKDLATFQRYSTWGSFITNYHFHYSDASDFIHHIMSALISHGVVSVFNCNHVSCEHFHICISILLWFQSLFHISMAVCLVTLIIFSCFLLFFFLDILHFVCVHITLHKNLGRLF